MAGSGSDLKAQLIRDILKYEAVKFGSFTLKSGVVSPIYMDIRVCVSHPKFLTAIAEAVEQTLKAANLRFDHLCGVPYTALPIATCISTKTHQPMLMRRKEAKAYGTKQIIEGKYRAGDKVLVIEDIVTSGSSILETVKVLENAGLTVTDAIVLIDREQGGKGYLEERGINLHPVLKLSEIIDRLEVENLIQADVAQRSREFIRTVKPSLTPAAVGVGERASFEGRARSAKHPVSAKLLKFVNKKKTNLCVAIDVETTAELLELTSKVAPYVCAVKTHVDQLSDFVYEKVIPELKRLSEEHSFLLFEDRKFGDIGETVRAQYGGGVFKISEWADIVTVHGVPGAGVIQGLKSAASEKNACIIVAEMSSAGALTDDSYKKACASMVESNADFVIGTVSQSRVVKSPEFIQFTPGVNFELSGDGKGQQYVPPEVAISDRGADIVIVGRGVTRNGDPGDRARIYSERAWEAYEKATGN
ncbi:LOW QUALITY PROTEIN: uridine 5'-monophosphate synthase-like [Galendromus occidentalis]|uniref:Uridine 5'-monophosphate synthase n=1 Tax=Galendromus occidentalis TaxID=34638 RepID=A0AAJ7L2U9_9ACAR|nr:LOW QUALITY PROTEIN: uridine 5'-monophosphate synthase-like [Galendromus occidentalis]